MARFFIDRPFFAWVIAIVIMLAGALSIQQLPVSQYPSIAPPAIVINARYPGASAKAVEDSVTQIIEQKLTGLDGLLYMKSTSDAYGNASTTLTFSADTDPDIAQVQVQNKMQTALPLLPQAVQSIGSNWVVTGGLAGGERIIVEGLQRVRPGAQVQAQEAGGAPAQAPAAPEAK